MMADQPLAIKDTMMFFWSRVERFLLMLLLLVMVWMELSGT